MKVIAAHSEFTPWIQAILLLRKLAEPIRGGLVEQRSTCLRRGGSALLKAWPSIDCTVWNLVARLLIASDTDAGLTRKAVLLDLCERTVVAMLFVNFAWRMLTSGEGLLELNHLLLLLSELLPVLFVVLRAPSPSLSQRPTDWAFAIMGTSAGLLVMPADVLPIMPTAVCALIIIAGQSLQVGAKIALGLSYGVVAANRGVKVLGPYRFVRHPIYAGYTISHIGGLLAMPSLTNAGLYAAALALQIVRIFCEERLLRKTAEYRAYAARVHWRLVPRIF